MKRKKSRPKKTISIYMCYINIDFLNVVVHLLLRLRFHTHTHTLSLCHWRNFKLFSLAAMCVMFVFILDSVFISFHSFPLPSMLTHSQSHRICLFWFFMYTHSMWCICYRVPPSPAVTVFHIKKWKKRRKNKHQQHRKLYMCIPFPKEDFKASHTQFKCMLPLPPPLLYMYACTSSSFSSSICMCSIHNHTHNVCVCFFSLFFSMFVYFADAHTHSPSVPLSMCVHALFY